MICFPSGANFVRDVSVKNKSETNSVLEVNDDGQFLYEISVKYFLCLLMLYAIIVYIIWPCVAALFPN